MLSFLKYLIRACAFLILTANGSMTAGPVGFLEGHLRIISPKEVELADASSSKGTTENYAEYPLVVMTADGKKEAARVTADGNGNYRVALPPGDYILDVPRTPRGRPLGHLRAKPQPFTVVSNQTVRVDMDIDTGIR
jgi:hypothetical protein